MVDCKVFEHYCNQLIFPNSRVRKCCQNAGCVSCLSWVWGRTSAPLLSSWQRVPVISSVTCFGANPTLPAWVRQCRLPAWWVISKFPSWKMKRSRIEMIFEENIFVLFLPLLHFIMSICQELVWQSDESHPQLSLCSVCFLFNSFATRNAWMLVRPA